MRKPLLYPFLALLACAAACACAADKPDARLARKVTIQCAHMRLHTAIEQIAAKTRVSITTGASETDWQVRDIPVLVCANNIALGDLLNAIAETNHLVLSASKDSKGVASYKLWRDKNYEDDMDAYRKEMRSTAIRGGKQDWNMIASLKDLSQPEFEGKWAGLSSVESCDTSAQPCSWAAEYRAIANVLARLEPQVIDKVMSGEQVQLTYATVPESAKPYFEQALRAFWRPLEASCAAEEGREPKPFDGKLLQAYPIKLSFDGVQLEIEAFSDGGLIHSVGRRFAHTASPLRYWTPPPPPLQQYSAYKWDQRYAQVRYWEPGGPEWLNTKIMIQAPKDGSTPTYTDLLCRLSSAIGYSIVPNGPAVRQAKLKSASYNKPPLVWCGREITAREILDSAPNSPVDWYVDQENKLMIGRGGIWTKQMDALIPEQLVTDLQKKLNGSGIELDDLEPFAKLTDKQRDEWFYHNFEASELAALPGPAACDGILKLYFSLSQMQRTRLKAGEPLSLARLDPQWLGPLLRKEAARKIEGYLTTGYKTSVPDAALAAYAKSLQALTDNDLYNLTLRLEKSPTPDGRHQYIFRVETGEVGGTILCDSIGPDLPIRPEDAQPVQPATPRTWQPNTPFGPPSYYTNPAAKY